MVEAIFIRLHESIPAERPGNLADEDILKMNQLNFEILSDEELDQLLDQNPKAARAYMRLLNQFLRPPSATAPEQPTAVSTTDLAGLACATSPLPPIENLQRIEVTIWDNADAHGNRPKGQTRYKAEIKAWTIDCEGVHAPRHQWRRNVPLYEKWPFTAKYEKLSLSPDYQALLGHMVDAGGASALYGMIGDKVGGTHYYDCQALVVELPQGVLCVGGETLALPSFVRSQAGTERKPLNDKIVGQSRWSKAPSGWASGAE